MSIIMPSGNNKLDWSPKGKMEKTAGAGAVVEVDELLAAAKGVIKAQAICPMADEKPDSGSAEIGSIDSGNLDSGKPAEDKPVDIKEALEKVEEAVVEAKEVAGVDEVEIDVEDAGVPSEIEIEIGGEQGAALGGEDIVIESKPEIEAACGKKGKKDDCGKKDEKKDSEKKDSGEKDSGKKEASTDFGMSKSSSTEEFCKFAMISPENRNKVKKYWIEALGFPADYVNLMIKDYEK